MANCPRDGTPIDVDYGMATCPSCGMILFVDMDGEAMIGSQASEAPNPEHPALDPETPHAQASFDPEPTKIRTSPAEAVGAVGAVEAEIEPRTAEDAIAPDPAPEDDPLAALNPMPMGLEPAPLDSVPEIDAAPPMEMDQFLGYEPSPEGGEDPLAPVGGPGDPLGIADYANSEFSQAKDGPFLFRLIIAGLDSKELREALREAMNDDRFAWDVDGLLQGVSMGELHIRNVSPVKATILINRIKRLPVKIRWEQYPVTQAEPG